MQTDLDREFERERWRGQIRADVNSHEVELRKLWDWKDEVTAEVVTLKTKVAMFAAFAALVGSVVGGVITALVQRAIAP